MSEAPLLEARGLSKTFGGVRALADVGFQVEPGEVLGVIGPNGAGKTTLINGVSGFSRLDGGRVLFRGRDVSGWPPHRLADLGITRTFQVMRPYASLPAYKSLVIPLSSPRARRRGGRHGSRDDVAIDILEELGFERDSRVPYQRAGSLPTGYLKRLELGRCLALGPQVILCDEIFSGLAASEIASLLPLLERLRDEGVALVMVEHRLRALLRLADRILALAEGREIACGSPAEVVDHPEVRAAYLGHAEHPA